MKKQITTIDGVSVKVRYIFEKEDGSLWYALDVLGGYQGLFGDEYPVAK